MAVGIILTIAATAGIPILRAFGISMPAFQAVGGLVILFMGLELLQRIFLRFMGLILAAVGAQILLSGLHAFTPGS